MEKVRVVGTRGLGLAVASAMLAAGVPVEMLPDMRSRNPEPRREPAEADHEAIRRAEEKRQRKAAKLRSA